MNKSEKEQNKTADPSATAAAKQRGRRLKWLLGILAALVLVAVWQRERFANISDNFARRAIARRDEPAAEWWLQVSKRIAPDAAQTEFLLGRLCRRQGRMEEARQHLRRAKHLGYDEALVQREEWLALAQAGQMQIAENFLPDLLRDPQADGAEICEAYVIGYLRNRQFQSAMSLIQPWASDFPNDGQPLYWAGLIYREQLALPQAEQYLREALKRDDSHAAAALALADILLEAKRADEAIPYFRQARQDQDPVKFVAASVGLARCLRAEGNPQEAADVLREAETVDPQNVDVQVELANIEIGDGAYADVERRLQPLLAGNMPNRELRFAYATALRGMGKGAEAEPHFQYSSEAAAAITRANDLKVEVLKNRPQDIELRREIGEIYLQFGLPEEGVIWLYTVLEIDPLDGPTHQLLTDYYTQKAEADPQFATLAQRHQAMVQAGSGSGQPSLPDAPPTSNGGAAGERPASEQPKKEDPALP